MTREEQIKIRDRNALNAYKVDLAFYKHFKNCPKPFLKARVRELLREEEKQYTPNKHSGHKGNRRKSSGTVMSQSGMQTQYDTLMDRG